MEPEPSIAPQVLPELPRTGPAVLPELTPEPAVLPELPAPPTLGQRLLAGPRFLMGAFGVLAVLSALAAVPVLQLATLGWLLEAEGRVGRTGRLRGALPGVDKAAGLGAALMGLWLLCLPWLLLSGYAADAALLRPAGTDAGPARALARWAGVVGALTALQAAAALLRGGHFTHFFRPLSNLRWALGRLREPIVDPLKATLRRWLDELRPGHHLALGAQGLVAGAIWLAPPMGLFALGEREPGFYLLGWLALIVVVPWLVMGQARLAAEARFGAAFELRELRRRIARAPFAAAAAVVVVLAAALPLYLLKVEPAPRDALWLPAGVFLAAALPGRLLAGWAHARGGREGRAHPVLRLTGAAVVLPAVAAWVPVALFLQLFTWRGPADLLGQHAFLLPVAFH